MNFKDFPRFLNGESGRASHLLYKFEKQIATCNNSQIKIVTVKSLFERHLYLNATSNSVACTY